MSVYVKAPDARVDYRIDWGARHLGPWLITHSVWRVEPVEPGGLTVEGDSHDGRVTAVSISGGVAGHLYDLINHVTLSNGEQDERALSFRVEAR